MRAVILALFFAALAFAGEAFRDGYKAGYKAGYCYHKPGCYAPYPPYPPYPDYGEDNWTGGYNRGFLAGLADQ